MSAEASSSWSFLQESMDSDKQIGDASTTGLCPSGVSIVEVTIELTNRKKGDAAAVYRVPQRLVDVYDKEIKKIDDAGGEGPIAGGLAEASTFIEAARDRTQSATYGAEVSVLDLGDAEADHAEEEQDEDEKPKAKAARGKKKGKGARTGTANGKREALKGKRTAKVGGPPPGPPTAPPGLDPTPGKKVDDIEHDKIPPKQRRLLLNMECGPDLCKKVTDDVLIDVVEKAREGMGLVTTMVRVAPYTNEEPVKEDFEALGDNGVAKMIG